MGREAHRANFYFAINSYRLLLYGVQSHDSWTNIVSLFIVPKDGRNVIPVCGRLMIGVPISDPKTPPYILVRAEPGMASKMFPHITYSECPTGHILDGQFIVTGLTKFFSDMAMKVISNLPFSPNQQFLSLCQPDLAFLHCEPRG